jgi:hypothetical protein
MSDLYINVQATGSTASGIKYQRVVPVQRTSYRTGDIGWQVQNGTFNYSSDPAFPIYYQELDLAAGVNYFYTLKHNNAFGNKNRFTTSIGTPASDGLAQFLVADFTGAINGYVIDHLTGMGYNVLTGTNYGTSGTVTHWNGAIDAANASTFGGFTDWFMIGVEHYMSVNNMIGSPFSTNNIFRYSILAGGGLTFNFVYTATTPAVNTAQAIAYRQTSLAPESANKTGFSQIGAIFARNHY